MPVMKNPALLSIILFLTGCAFGTSTEIKRAEKLIQQFQCNNIDTDQLRHNPITSFHERTLAISKYKSIEYLNQYKSGDAISDMPLYEIIQMQYVSYKSACQFLGGLTPSIQVMAIQ